MSAGDDPAVDHPALRGDHGRSSSGTGGATAPTSSRWTSRSTQLLDRRVLGWASPAFHYGALAAIGGHVIGLCIPQSLTDVDRDLRGLLPLVRRDRRRDRRRWSTLVGFLGLLYRRTTSDRVRRTTTRIDMVTYFLLTVLIVLGCWMTFGHTLFTGDPYNYRDTIGDWWRSLFYLDPDVDAVDRRAAGLPAARDHRLGASGRRSRSAASSTPGASRCSTSAAPTSSTGAATPPADARPAPRAGRAPTCSWRRCRRPPARS